MRTPQGMTRDNINNALDTIQVMQLHIKLIKTVANISQRESQKGILSRYRKIVPSN